MSTSETITRTDLTNILNEVLPAVSDSGTNYVKFGDVGICWGYSDLPAMTSPNGYAYVTPTWPITFKSAPIVVPFLSAGFGAGRVIGVQAVHNAQTTTGGSIFVTNNTGGQTGASTNGIGWVAIGQI